MFHFFFILTKNFLLDGLLSHSTTWLGPRYPLCHHPGDFFSLVWSCFFFFFFCPPFQHMEVFRPGVEPEKQQWQHQILNPLSHQGTLSMLLRSPSLLIGTLSSNWCYTFRTTGLPAEVTFITAEGEKASPELTPSSGFHSLALTSTQPTSPSCCN